MITSVLLSLPSQFTARGTNSEKCVRRSVVGGGIEWSDQGEWFGCSGARDAAERKKRAHTHTQPLQRASFTPSYSAPAILCVESRVERRIFTTRSLEALWAPTFSWGPYGPFEFFFLGVRALRLCNPQSF